MPKALKATCTDTADESGLQTPLTFAIYQMVTPWKAAKANLKKKKKPLALPKRPRAVNTLTSPSRPAHVFSTVLEAGLGVRGPYTPH